MPYLYRTALLGTRLLLAGCEYELISIVDFGGIVAERTYGLSEIVGTSEKGVDAAIKNGIDRASQSLCHLDWFEVTDIRGYIRDGSVHHMQVTMKLGFRMEDPK